MWQSPGVTRDVEGMIVARGEDRGETFCRVQLGSAEHSVCCRSLACKLRLKDGHRWPQKMAACPWLTRTNSDATTPCCLNCCYDSCDGAGCCHCWPLLLLPLLLLLLLHFWH
jgi:hypothetical protein